MCDYYDIIKNPMDLETIRAKVDACRYLYLGPFLKDISLIQENAEYNPVSRSAKDTRSRDIVHHACNLRTRCFRVTLQEQADTTCFAAVTRSPAPE